MLSFITWNVDPILFQIGSFGVRYYSLCFLMAFLMGYVVLARMYKHEGVDIKYLDKLLVYIFLATLIGARLGHCLFYEPGYYLTGDHWIEMILPCQRTPDGWVFTGYEGLASHGAAIGMLIALWILYRRHNISPVWVVDRLVIIVAQGGFYIRLGNLFNSEIYGFETSMPWGFIFLQNGETVPKHPTQLYESLSYLVIFLVCMYFYGRRSGKLKPGALFGWWLIALFGARFLIEFVKERQVGFEKGMLLDMGQWLSIPFICLGVVVLVMAYRGVFTDKILMKKGDKVFDFSKLKRK
ncbi:MAG: prolipoprotein diacylglyceryl transferase [Bacteroidales bacterium]|nr:prolipoprotein diacylglyceryl transferase [Bacteroidales bacterium]